MTLVIKYDELECFAKQFGFKVVKSTVYITDLDKLNLVKTGNGGLVLPLSQLLLLLRQP